MTTTIFMTKDARQVPRTFLSQRPGTTSLDSKFKRLQVIIEVIIATIVKHSFRGLGGLSLQVCNEKCQLSSTKAKTRKVQLLVLEFPMEFSLS